MIYIVLILSILLRLVSLNQSLWLDEATTALVARMDTLEFFTKFMPADFHPPLYYLVVNLWSTIFGYGEIALRMPSVIFGVLSVYVTYLIAKDLKYKWPIVPALFLATSGLHIYYSQEARMYSMATFLVCLIFLLFIKKQWFLMSVSFALLFFTDYVSVIVVPVLFLYQFLNNRKDFRKFSILIFPIWTAFLFWWPTLSQQLTAGFSLKETSSAWWNVLGPVTVKNVALIPTKFLIGRVSFDNKIVYGLIIVVISVIFAYVIGKAKNKLVWYWFVGSLIVGILLSFYIPTLTYFRYLFILPAFYLLLSEKASRTFIVIVLAINILSSCSYLFNSRFHRENWREIAKTVGDDKIIYPSDSQKEALYYYGINDSQIINKEVLDGEKQIWLSRYVWNIFDSEDSTRKYIEELGYNMDSEVNLNGVVFWKYIKNK